MKFDFQYDPKEVTVISTRIVPVHGVPHVEIVYEPVVPTPHEQRTRTIELLRLE